MQPFPDHHVGTLVGIMLIIVLLLFWAIYRMERKYKTERRQKMELPQWVFDEPQPGEPIQEPEDLRRPHLPAEVIWFGNPHGSNWVQDRFLKEKKDE